MEEKKEKIATKALRHEVKQFLRVSLCLSAFVAEKP